MRSNKEDELVEVDSPTPTFTGNTYGEAVAKMNDWMIAESTREIRAAGISEAEETKILARGMKQWQGESLPLDGKTISLIFAIAMAIFLLGLFLGR